MAEEKAKKKINLLSIAQKVARTVAEETSKEQPNFLSAAQTLVRTMAEEKAKETTSPSRSTQAETSLASGEMAKETTSPSRSAQPKAKTMSGRNAQEMPKLLVISDEDYVYGYHEGYYPEVTKLMRNQERDQMLMTRHDAEKRWGRGILATSPVPDKHECYLLNPYDQIYYLAGSSAWENKLIETKELVYKRVLQMLGAKKVRLVRNVEEELKSREELDVNGKAGTFVGRVEASGHYDEERRNKTSAHTAIEFEDSTNSPSSPEEIREFMLRSGMSNELSLMLLVEELEQRTVVSGKHKFTAVFLSEMDDAQNLVAQLSGGWKAFGASLSSEYKRNSSRKYRQEQILEVEF